MSGGHHLPNRVSVYGQVADTSASGQYTGFLCSQVI